MSYIFDWQNKKSSAIAFLKGAPLSVLIAYTLYADDFGNAWCSSNSQKTGGLNRVTGLSHDAIVGKSGARRVLVEHGCIEIVPISTVREMYAGRPISRRPPVNAVTYHITHTIRHCIDGDCTCRKILHVEIRLP